MQIDKPTIIFLLALIAILLIRVMVVSPEVIVPTVNVTGTLITEDAGTAFVEMYEVRENEEERVAAANVSVDGSFRLTFPCKNGTYRFVATKGDLSKSALLYGIEAGTDYGLGEVPLER